MPEIIQMHLPQRVNNPQVPMKPAGIILHYIGNPGTSARANANYFANVNSMVSVHYIVDDSEIIEIIPPWYTSYGTDNGAYNRSYVQIEMCHPDTSGRISEATLNNTVWLCRELMRRYGVLEVIRHHDASTKKKRCPVWYVEHPEEWTALKERILEEDMTYEKFAEYMARYEQEQREKDVSAWAKEAWDKAKQSGVMDGTAPQSPLTREQFAVVMDRLAQFD